MECGRSCADDGAGKQGLGTGITAEGSTLTSETTEPVRRVRGIAVIALVQLLTAGLPAEGEQPDVRWMVGGHSDVIHAIAASADGQLLASVSSDETVKLWRVSDGRLLRTMFGHVEYPSCVAFFAGRIDARLRESRRCHQTLADFGRSVIAHAVRTLQRHDIRSVFTGRLDAGICG